MPPNTPLGKKPTACVPCHERKVRCDTTGVGVPCTRCVTKDRAQFCVLLARGINNSHKRRRTIARQMSPGQQNGDNVITDESRLRTPVSRGACQASQDINAINRGSLGPGESSPLVATAPSHGDAPRSIPRPGLTSVQYMVSEDDAHLQTLCQMSDGDAEKASPVSLCSSNQGQQVIEYYGELNSISVLGEVLGQSHRRLIRIDLPGPPAMCAKQREFSRLEPADVDYLNAKHVHNLPPKSTCLYLLQLFFQFVYPYTPIVDRQQLMDDFESDNCSSFLLWTIFANVASLTSPDWLLEAGYAESSIAQKEFFTKARLLFDFGCEKGQLTLIQGSIMLSSFQFSFAPDKDFRFWFHNAVRIATQMGFNKKDLGRYIDANAHRLSRRIWWVLYSRDVWFNLYGCENARRISDYDAEIEICTDDDWAPEMTIGRHHTIIPKITTINQHFLRENTQLALFGAQFLHIFRSKSHPLSIAVAEDFVNMVASWRSSLPEDLLLDCVRQWTDSNFWVLFLWTMSYRLECSFYRTMRQRAHGLDKETSLWAAKRFPNSVFELDTLLMRAVVHDVARYCPPSLIICASHLLGFQLDLALDPNTSSMQKLRAQTQINVGLAHLRDEGKRWLNAKWACRVFENVIDRTGLSMAREEPATHWRCTNPDSMASRQTQWNRPLTEAAFDLNTTSIPPGVAGISDQWINDLLTENLMNGMDDGLFNIIGP